MNRKNKVTRRRVNDSVIDSVLNDVYDEIDKLQVSNEYNIASSNVDNQGEYTTYSSPGGANYFAINTEKFKREEGRRFKIPNDDCSNLLYSNFYILLNSNLLY